MARRKARWQPGNTSSTSDEKYTSKVWQMSTESKANHTTSKKGVARARQKHMNDNLPLPEPPTLADRFNALPTELRLYIFSLLIVQPVKWDLAHNQDCPLRERIFDMTPEPPTTHYPWRKPSICANCDNPHLGNPSFWAVDVRFGLNIWTNPWRSQWAPPIQNPFLCSDCYDTLHRPKPYPKVDTLPCLCARRQNLELLLVCKKWYHEATQIFYTSNTFAFESPQTFLSFTASLPPNHRAKLSKISFLSLTPSTPGDFDIDAGYPVDPSDPYKTFIFPRPWSAVWRTLRTYPSLTHLDLDARLLKHAKTARSLRKLGLLNLRKINFLERPPLSPAQTLHLEGTEKIWPSIACRSLLIGGYAGKMGRAIKGEPVKLLRGAEGRETLNTAVEYCHGYGITESHPFEYLKFSKTETRSLYVAEDDGFGEDHLGLLGLHLG